MFFSRRDFVTALVCSGAGALAYGADKDSGGSSGVPDPAKPVFVVATIQVKAGKRAEFIKIFQGNVPKVTAEKGCKLYAPAIDVASGIGAQIPLRDNVMTVVEQWESLKALQDHLVAPHMNTYREAVKDLVESVTLQVMQPA